jgi:hypothetical protein
MVWLDGIEGKIAAIGRWLSLGYVDVKLIRFLSEAVLRVSTISPIQSPTVSTVD